MMGTIHAVRELGRPRKSLFQDLFKESSARGNEAQVRALYEQLEMSRSY